MKITYSLTPEDYVHMHQMITWRSPKFRKKLWFQRIYNAGWLLLVAAAYYFDDVMKGKVIFLSLAATWFLFYPVLVKGQFRRSARADVRDIYPFAIDQPIELELKEDCFEEHRVGVETRAGYEAIVEIVETKDHILIRLKTAACFLVPKLWVSDWEPFAERLKELAATFQFKYEEVKAPWWQK